MEMAEETGHPDQAALHEAGIAVREFHYNRGRPHSALGPGLLEPMSEQVPSNEHRHSLPVWYRVVKRSRTRRLAS